MLKGSCLCGAIQFETAADPQGISMCHCEPVPKAVRRHLVLGLRGQQRSDHPRRMSVGMPPVRQPSVAAARPAGRSCSGRHMMKTRSVSRWAQLTDPPD